ncbi:Flo11 domain-containing protein [[Candida] zeylanoides]
MRISKIYLTLASACLLSTVTAAPTNKNDVLRRDDSGDDDDDAVIVHVMTTVQNVHTNYETVQGQMSTSTNLIVDTTTTTFTRYTATVTSTVLGQEYTYTTVVNTPVDSVSSTLSASTPSTDSPVTPTSSAPTTVKATSPAKPPTSTQNAVTDTPKVPTVKPTPTQAAETSSPTTTAIIDSQTNLAPTITNPASIPSSTDSWIIEDVATTTSGGVCYVNYDYYYASDDIETVTSTSIIYTTVTLS